MRARVFIRLKSGVLDPQGQAIENSLVGLGFGENVKHVRQGKLFDVELADGLNQEQAKEILSHMCQSLLANQVIEDFDFEILS